MIWVQIFGMVAATLICGKVFRGRKLTVWRIGVVIFWILLWPWPVASFLYGFVSAAWTDLTCCHRRTVQHAGSIHCLDCGRVQMLMRAPSGRVLVRWIAP